MATIKKEKLANDLAGFSESALEAVESISSIDPPIVDRAESDEPAKALLPFITKLPQCCLWVLGVLAF